MLKTFQIAFGEPAGNDPHGGSGNLVGADSDPHSPCQQVLGKFHTLSLFSEPGCVNEVLGICRLQHIHAVIPLTNKAVEFLDDNRSAFQSAGVTLFIQDRETIAVCHDKLKLAEFFSESDISIPSTWPAPRTPGDLRFPLILKQRRGEGGKNSFKLENRKDLEFYVEKYPDHVVQHFIEGQEFSIDWYSDQSGRPLVIVPRERLAVRAGEVMVSRIRLDEEIIEAVRDVGGRLKLRGPCCIQGIRDSEGRFHFTDFNLRFGSGSVHTIKSGANIPLLIYKELAGEPLEDVARTVQDGSIMTRYNDGFYIQ